MSLLEQDLYRTNLENTELRKANDVLRSTLKTIAMTSREQYIRDLAFENLRDLAIKGVGKRDE